MFDVRHEIVFAGVLTMATSNPAFSQDMFAGYEQVYGVPRSTTMTVQGTMVKALALLAILCATAAWSWNATSQGQIAGGLLFGSMIGGFIFAMITIYRPTAAPWTAPVYAAFEGVFLGSLSQIIDTRFSSHLANARRGIPNMDGIAMQAVSLTLGVLFVMLFVYATGLIRVTEKLKTGIVAATGAVCLFYFVSIVLRMFGIEMPLVFSSSVYGIGFSLFVVGLAAFNLLLDFDFIEKGAQSNAPKYMEWYGAFGLMVTLVWLYLEILRLLQKLADRR
jgi:uncharacterized YccA/Bax inhibitor family protein